MAILGGDRKDLNFRQEDGTTRLRSFIESTIVSESPDIDRVTRYSLFFHFYKGKHWRYYNQTFLSFNYTRAFIDKVISFLLGKKTFSINMARYDASEVDKEQESAMEGFFERNWLLNKKVTKVYDLLQMGSITGDCWAYLSWNESNYVNIDCLDSRQCFPEFENGDINRLTAFYLRQPLISNDKGYIVFVTKVTKDEISTWFQKTTELKGARHEEVINTNPYGFIPIVHIKNRPTSDEYYAKSDIEDILKINKVYNETAQRIKTIVDYYSAPVTVITGGNAKSLVRGTGTVWSGLPSDAHVFNLTLGEDLSAAMNFLQMLKTSMHEIADVPENSLGRLQHISNTSAAALQVTYQPLIQQADLKWICYGEGIAEINRMIYLITKVKNPSLLSGFPEDYDSEYYTDISFEYGLPQDKTVLLNQMALEKRLFVASRREIMGRLGKTNIPQLMQEIEEDMILEKELSGADEGGLPEEISDEGGANAGASS